MKKSFIFSLFLILILGNTITIHGMVTTKMRRFKAPRTTYRPTPTSKAVYHTKAYQPPHSLRERLRQSYTRFKEFLFGPGKTKIEILDETTQLLNDIEEEKPGCIKSLGTFIKENNQETINNFLNKLVVSENGLNTLNAYVFGLKFGLEELKNKNNIKLIQKIINWTKNNIVQLFGLNLPIDEDFFLINLVSIDDNLELAPVI